VKRTTAVYLREIGNSAVAGIPAAVAVDVVPACCVCGCCQPCCYRGSAVPAVACLRAATDIQLQFREFMQL